jgi:hypothetical protein
MRWPSQAANTTAIRIKTNKPTVFIGVVLVKRGAD